MTRKPSLTDIRIGTLLREIRTEEGYTQKELADELGISFQQLQKYENGINRLSVSRLMDISEILNTPIMKFIPIGENDE